MVRYISMLTNDMCLTSKTFMTHVASMKYVDNSKIFLASFALIRTLDIILVLRTITNFFF